MRPGSADSPDDDAASRAVDEAIVRMERELIAAIRAAMARLDRA